MLQSSAQAIRQFDGYWQREFINGSIVSDEVLIDA
jgi:hypothetical protein